MRVYKLSIRTSRIAVIDIEVYRQASKGGYTSFRRIENFSVNVYALSLSSTLVSSGAHVYRLLLLIDVWFSAHFPSECALIVPICMCVYVYV